MFGWLRTRPRLTLTERALAAANHGSMVGRAVRSLGWTDWTADAERISFASLRAVLYHHYTRGLDDQTVWRSPKECCEMARAVRREALRLVKTKPETAKLASSGGRRR